MNEFAAKVAGGEVALQPRGTQAIPLLDEPPVGHMQALALRTFQDLENEASAINVLQTMSLASGAWIDHSQIYAIVRKLAKRSPALIKVKEVRPRQGKRPEVKIWELTTEGVKALNEATAHHEAVAAYLNGTFGAGDRGIKGS